MVTSLTNESPLQEAVAPATGAVPIVVPIAAVVGPAVKLARGVTEAAGVLVGAANAVRVRSAAKVPTAWVRISSGLIVTVGVRSAGVAPQALSNKAPIINICIPTINRNLSILTPFHTRRYFTWNLLFVQRYLDTP